MPRRYVASLLLFHLLKRCTHTYDCLYQNSINQLHKIPDSMINIDEVKKRTPKFHELSGIVLRKWKVCLIIILQTMEILIGHDYFKIYGSMLLL